MVLVGGASPEDGSTFEAFRFTDGSWEPVDVPEDLARAAGGLPTVVTSSDGGLAAGFTTPATDRRGFDLHTLFLRPGARRFEPLPANFDRQPEPDRLTPPIVVFDRAAHLIIGFERQSDAVTLRWASI